MFAQPYMGEAHVQSAPEVNPIKPDQKTEETKAVCHDWPFALLFVLNVGVIIALTALWGVKTVTDPDNNSSELLSGDDTKVVVAIAVGMAVVSMVLALLMVKLIVAYARVMILFVLWFNVGISFALAAYGFIIGNIFIAIIGLIIALLNLCYARAVQHRIPFAVANLRVAEGAIAKHSSTYLVSIVFTVVQIVWVVVWAMALLGVANKIAEDNPSSTTTANTNTTTSTRSTYKQSGESYVAYFFLLLSFYWGLQVFKNIAHTTVAGTVASFWYQSESKGATGGALKRSTTTSFGSICFGSLIVAFLQALRALAESGRQDGSALACFAECILGCLQSLMEYFNRWAYVYVGIYGYKFTQAGKAVFQLFKERGFDAIINDDLIGNVLGFAALGVGLICAGVGALIAETTDVVSFQNSTAFLAILGLVVGIGVAVTPLAVIDSSVATIFVCFAEDPAAFQRSHPELYAPLVQEWHNLYPEIMVQAGYWYA
uniref:Choline transporter-like protein n=1 Tax=Phytophthora ramorum TaxID=164328 RepID=H3GNL3_PHYRM